MGWFNPGRSSGFLFGLERSFVAFERLPIPLEAIADGALVEVGERK
jgi:hypothetical protein